MNATELLKQDHDLVMHLIERLESAGPGAELRGPRLELFGRLKSALSLHTFLEEQVFYHSLANQEDTRDLVRAAYDEHRKVDGLLIKLSGASSHWQADLGLLKATLKQHVEKEEGELFPKADRILGRDRLEDLGRQLENIREGKAALA